MERKVQQHVNASVGFTITIALTPPEAKALDAIAGYNIDNFLEVFYEKMGKSYLRPHEDALRTLFNKLKSELPISISKIEKAQKAIIETLKDFLRTN